MQIVRLCEWRSLESLYIGKQFQSFLYVFGTEQGCKIGISQFPHRRAQAVETASGKAVREGRVLYGHYDAIAAERAAHADLEQFRERGEWFTCPISVALESLRHWEWHAPPPITLCEFEQDARSGERLDLLKSALGLKRDVEILPAPGALALGDVYEIYLAAVLMHGGLVEDFERVWGQVEEAVDIFTSVPMDEKRVRIIQFIRSYLAEMTGGVAVSTPTKD